MLGYSARRSESQEPFAWPRTRTVGEAFYNSLNFMPAILIKRGYFYMIIRLFNMFIIIYKKLINLFLMKNSNK